MLTRVGEGRRAHKLYPGRVEVPWRDGGSHMVRGELQSGEPCGVVQF